MLVEYASKVFSDCGYEKLQVPFKNNLMPVFFKTIKIAFSNKYEPAKVQVCYLIADAFTKGTWKFNQKTSITLPEFRLEVSAEFGVKKAFMDSIRSRFNNKFVHTPIATGYAANPEMEEKFKLLLDLSEELPKENVDVYLEMPTILTSANLLMSTKVMKEKTVPELIVNDLGSSGKSALILNYQGMRKFVKELEGQLE